MEENNFLNSEQYQRMNEYLQRQNDLLAPYLEMQQRIDSIYNSEGYQAALRATEAWNNQASNPITFDLNSIVNDLTHNINSIKFALPVLDTIANMPDCSSLFNRLNNTLSNYENNEHIQNILMQEAPEEIAVKFNRV